MIYYVVLNCRKRTSEVYYNRCELHATRGCRQIRFLRPTRGSRSQIRNGPRRLCNTFIPKLYTYDDNNNNNNNMLYSCVSTTAVGVGARRSNHRDLSGFRR
uniref:Uncharacterized protein n=1 Tax=Schizaphis graminum TaxID=13262 RepID=A0A2S2PML7_SCHGA